MEGWKRITNDPYVLSIIAKGYRLRFTSPPLLRQPPWEIRSPQGPQEILGMREQITLMLQKNAITEVPPNLPGFYSNVFLVRKASGGWRPVIDLKNLNAHIHAPHFRMFTTSSVLSSLRKGDYVFKIDLQDVYFHVPIHPSSRKYLRFAFENKVYQFQVLPFSPPRDRGTYLQGLEHTRSRHVCNTVELPPSSVHVSNSGAKSPSGGCSVSGLAGEVNVHVSPIPPAQQSHSEASIHSGGRVSSRSPLVADSIVVSTPTTSLCGTPPSSSYRWDLLSQQDQKYVSDGKSYHLHAWRLSCDTIKQQAFQKRSLGSRQPLGGPQPIACTTIGGFASLDGPQDKGLIHLIPQLLR